MNSVWGQAEFIVGLREAEANNEAKAKAVKAAKRRRKRQRQKANRAKANAEAQKARELMLERCQEHRQQYEEAIQEEVEALAALSVAQSDFDSFTIDTDRVGVLEEVIEDCREDFAEAKKSLLGELNGLRLRQEVAKYTVEVTKGWCFMDRNLHGKMTFREAEEVLSRISDIERKLKKRKTSLHDAKKKKAWLSHGKLHELEKSLRAAEERLSRAQKMVELCHLDLVMVQRFVDKGRVLSYNEFWTLKYRQPIDIVAIAQFVKDGKLSKQDLTYLHQNGVFDQRYFSLTIFCVEREHSLSKNDVIEFYYDDRDTRISELCNSLSEDDILYLYKRGVISRKLLSSLTLPSVATLAS